MNLGANPMAFTTSSASWKSGDVVPERFPAGLRVLVVDDDSTCLRILEKMLKKCLYEVTKCNRAEVALELLRDNKDGFDVVISDVHMPDMDGFKLLEHVGLEMDLPVIMMSADDSKTVVLKGVTHGACDYLIKPVRMEALKNIWQHVVRKKEHMRKDKDFKHSGSVEDGEQPQKPSGDVDCSSAANEGNWKGSKKRKDDEAEAEERGEASMSKKQRVVWTVELHQQFVNAVNQLGIDKAVPKKILELMDVPDLTRENVASHLQKYRLYLRRLSGQHQNSLGNSFIGPADASFGPLSSLNGRELQALASSGQLPPQNLATIQAATLGRATNKSPISAPIADQRNIFSFRSPKIRFVEGQKQHNSSSKQVNLLHGIPTNMYPKQLAGLHLSAQPFGNMNMHVHSQPSQSSSLRAQMVQPQPRNHIPNEVSSSHVLNLPSSVGQPVFSQSIPGLVLDQNGTNNVHAPRYISPSQPSATVDFAKNTFPVVSTSGIATPNSNGMLQEEFTLEMQGSGGFVPNYDVFNELNQNRTEDWSLQSAGSMFDAPQHSNIQGRMDVAPSILSQPGISSDQNNGHAGIPSVNKGAFLGADGLGNFANLGQHLSSSWVDNSLRIKAERLPDVGFHNDLFPDQFGQEDLMSTISNQHQEGMAPVENEFGFDGYHLDNLLV